MGRNIDLLAIALLLAGVAFLTVARQSSAVQSHSVRLVNFTTRHLQQLDLQPHLPQLCFSRD